MQPPHERAPDNHTSEEFICLTYLFTFRPPSNKPPTVINHPLGVASCLRAGECQGQQFRLEAWLIFRQVNAAEAATHVYGYILFPYGMNHATWNAQWGANWVWWHFGCLIIRLRAPAAAVGQGSYHNFISVACHKQNQHREIFAPPPKISHHK